MAGMPGRRPSAPPGNPASAWPTLAFGTLHRPRRRAGHLAPAAPTPSCRPLAGGGGFASAVAARARALRAVDALQRLEPHGPARPARLERPALLLRGRRGAALAHDARARRRRCTPGRTAGSTVQHLGHGHRQPGPHRRRGAGGLPDEHRIEPAGDAGRRPAASRPTRTSPTTGAWGSRRPSSAGRQPLHVLAPRVRRRQQRRSHRPLRLEGQRGRHPGRARRKDPNELLLALPDGTFRPGRPSRAGILDPCAHPRRGARRPQQRRPARPRGGAPLRERQRASQRRQRERRVARGRWATGSA